MSSGIFSAFKRPPASDSAPGRAGAEAFERDPVAQGLINAGIVSVEQARAAQRYVSATQPLWRVLVALDGVDRSKAFELAARMNGFERVELGAHPQQDFVTAVLGLIPPVAVSRIDTLGLLPYKFGYDTTAQQQRLVFATHDPGSSDVQALVQALGSEVELVYAEETSVRTRLDKALASLDIVNPSSAHVSGDGAATPPPEPGFEDVEIEHAPEQGDGAATPPPEPTASSSPPHSAAPMPPQSRDRVVGMLLHKNIVTPQQVDRARQTQDKERKRDALWRVLVDVAGVDREAVYAEAALVYAFPHADLAAKPLNVDFLKSVMATFAEPKRDRLLELRVVPLECEVDGQTGAVRLVFVSHDPARPEVHKLLTSLRLERYELQYAPEQAVRDALVEAYPRKNEFLDRLNEDGGGAVDLGMSFENKESGLVDEDALEAEIGRSALINLFEATLIEAVRQGASDIHIYPNARRQLEIHFRVDGRLAKWYTEEKAHPEAVLAVIKDNATNVDRFERDLAQDGFIQRKVDDALIRFRVSVLPIATANPEVRAESIVIRILDDRKVVTDLRKLGLLDTALERFDRAIRQPHGMVILTGPTGSGKSTTLVASLYQVVTPEVNVLTVEDPVEYIIPGVRQIKLSHKLNLEGALRAILRHDPDVVMVGEMRDRDTAELAIKLANTGHLTFSTLHTNDAPSAVSRLYKMGVEPFLIAYAINLVVAQRLIRGLCPKCKKVDDDPDTVLLKRLGFSKEEIEETTFYKAVGCPECKKTGYKGRRAITEALYFSRDIRHMIVEASEAIDEDAIRQKAREEGMLTLQDSARELVKMGEVSVDEMVRVTATEGG